jgi:hypothetical protein
MSAEEIEEEIREGNCRLGAARENNAGNDINELR